jgi:hypothetical protein
MFPDNSAFKRIPMHHTGKDNEEAAKKAVDLLNAKELADSGKYFGLYLQQLQERIKSLRALNEPMIGDGLVKSDTDQTFWLASLMPKAEKLDAKNLKQQGAVPLSSFLRFDPWTDQLVTMHTAFEPILSASDKMPFEVTPVYIKLGYYKSPADTPPAPATSDPNAAAAAPATAPATPPPPAADPNAAPPAPTVPPPPPPGTTATPPPDSSPTASSRN